jgi:hypothetical protein
MLDFTRHMRIYKSKLVLSVGQLVGFHFFLIPRIFINLFVETAPIKKLTNY